jgi:precorrin-6A/cobalt-precorrin-6A reductase
VSPDQDIILILGGTREAAELAAELVAQTPRPASSPRLPDAPRSPPRSPETRTGGFGGVDGLGRYLRETGVTRLIDATHPFARQISANAVEAAGSPAFRLRSEPASPGAGSPATPGSRWKRWKGPRRHPVRARVLLALGSQHIGLFASRDDVHFVVRMIDPPETPLDLPDHTLVLGRPGDTAAVETMLLIAHSITHIVCRNSGGAGCLCQDRGRAGIGAAGDHGLARRN